MARLYKVKEWWYADFSVGGRRHRESLNIKDDGKRGSEEEANRAMYKMIEDCESRKPSSRMKWQHFKDLFFGHYKLHQRDNSIYRVELALSELERVASTPITMPEDVTVECVQDAQATWIKEGKGRNAIDRSIQAICVVMRWGEERKDIGLIPQSWKRIKRLEKKTKHRTKYFTREELGKLLAICKDKWHTIARLGMECGMRLSEVYWQEKANIDFQGGRLYIRPKDDEHPTLKDIEGRWIPVPPALLEHLRAISMQNIGPYLLGEDRNTTSVISVMMRRFIKEAGIGHGTFHTLRRSFATHALADGVSPRTLQAWLGHKSSAMMDRYTMLRNESEAAERAKLQEIVPATPQLKVI